jgi:flagellar biosynthesis component FlhA
VTVRSEQALNEPDEASAVLVVFMVVPAMTVFVVVVLGAVVVARVWWRDRHGLATRCWAQA